MLNSDQERQRAAEHIKSFDESAVIRTQGASDISDGTSSVGGASKSQLHKTCQVPQVHTAQVYLVNHEHEVHQVYHVYWANLVLRVYHCTR